jgi:hypothetical protein
VAIEDEIIKAHDNDRTSPFFSIWDCSVTISISFKFLMFSSGSRYAVLQYHMALLSGFDTTCNDQRKSLGTSAL